MLDPLTSAIRSGRHALSHSSSVIHASSARASSSPARNSGFMQLLPRRMKRIKGKERATSTGTEDMMDWEHMLQCQKWIFAFKQDMSYPLHCRFLLLEEFTHRDGRTSGSATVKLQPCTPKIHAYTNHVPIHLQQRSYASNAVDPRIPQPISTGESSHHPPLSDVPPSATSIDSAESQQNPNSQSQPESDPSLDPSIPPILAHFCDLLDSRPSSMKDVWAAYSLVVSAQATGLLRSIDILKFADRLLSSGERQYRRSPTQAVLHMWSERIHGVLNLLENRTLSPFEQFRRGCSMSRATALNGELQQAIRYVHEALSMQSEQSILTYKAYNALLKSIHFRYGAARALEFLVLEWDFVGKGLLAFRKRDLEPLATSLRETAFSVIDSLTMPHRVLAEHADWETQRRIVLGEFMLAALLERKQGASALTVYREMERQLLRPGVNVSLSLVRLLAKDESFEAATAIYKRIKQDNAKFKYYLSTGLYLYGRQGKEEEAEACYTTMEQLGINNFADQGKLLHMYAWQGKVEATLKTFDRFFPRVDGQEQRANSPRAHEYAMVIYAYAQRGDIAGINYWLQNMASSGVTPDGHVYNTVLKSFALRGDLDSVASVLKKMRKDNVKPSVISYTIVISLLAHRKDPVGAERVYMQAITDGIVPDRPMVTSLMNAHVEAGSWRGVIRAFNYLKALPNSHLHLTVEVYNTLLKAYVLIGAPFRIVSRLFSQLEDAHAQPDAYTFSLLVQSACDSGLMHIAATIVQDIEQGPHRNGHLNTYVLTILMAGYLQIGDKVKAKATYDSMLNRGMQPTSVTFSIILKAYGNEKSEDSFRIAEEFVEQLMSVEPAQRTWNVPQYGKKTSLEHIFSPLLASHAREGRAEEAERTYKQMLDAGGEPSLGSLTYLLSAYYRAFNVDAVVQLWPQIFHLGLRHLRSITLDDSDNDCEVNRVHLKANILCIPLSIYIHALSAAGRHLEIAAAWRNLQTHGFHFDSCNYNHLIVALVRAGEPERAFEVLERVILPHQRIAQRTMSKHNQSPDSPLSFEQDQSSTALSSSDILPAEEEQTIHEVEDVPEDASGTTDPDPSSLELRSESPMHNSVKRATQVQLSTYHTEIGPLRELEDQALDEFAHPLHILSQFSPTWNLWRPHLTTLNALLMVLARLRAGFLINPVTPADASSSAAASSSPSTDQSFVNSEADYDMHDSEGQLPPRPDQSQAEIAREMLRRIYQNYPDAVTLVLRHEVTERRRLRRRYDHMYLGTDT